MKFLIEFFRYLTESTGTIFCPLIKKLRCFVIFVFLDLKVIVFVFPIFSLFAWIHWTINFRHLLIHLLSFFNEFSVNKRLVSSAKWCTVEKSTALWKSLMERIKRIGPNINPWGLKVQSGDLVLLIVVWCFLSSRNDLSHLFDLSRIR